jgi:plastocyanin
VSRTTAARRALLPALCLAAVALSGAAAMAKAPPKPTRVTINDNFFAPDAVTIGRGGSVKWVWSLDNTNPHTVHLKSGPKGLKNKGSYSTKTSAVSEARFQKTFDTAGTYKFICTIHPTEMKMTIAVRK